MKFFNQISNLLPDGVDLNISIRKNGDIITVSVLPKSDSVKDDAKNSIIPLVISGTENELDSGFIEAISHPVQKASGLLINMDAFDKQTAIAEQNSKAEKSKKENFDKLSKKADQFEKEGKTKEAISCLKQAREFTTDLNKLNNRLLALENKSGANSLFQDENEATPEPEVNYLDENQTDIIEDEENNNVEEE